MTLRKYKTPDFQPGDRCAYSVQFLKSIGESHGEMAHGRGTIREIKRYTDTLILASIDWGGAELPEKVNVCNLAKVGPNPRFANVD